MRRCGLGGGCGRDGCYAGDGCVRDGDVGEDLRGGGGREGEERDLAPELVTTAHPQAAGGGGARGGAQGGGGEGGANSEPFRCTCQLENGEGEGHDKPQTLTSSQVSPAFRSSPTGGQCDSETPPPRTHSPAEQGGGKWAGLHWWKAEPGYRPPP